MKSFIVAVLFAFASAAFAADASRVVTLTGCAHPRAEIVSVDAARGIVVYNWLSAAGVRVDSGNSVARFTPQANPSDATLASAIAASQ